MATGFDPARIFRSSPEVNHACAIGMTYVDHGEDWCELALPYDPRLIGDVASGVLASGPVLTLMDMAASAAVWVRMKAFRPVATLDLRIDYLRPAAPGRTVIGRAVCARVTRSVAFLRGEAHDGDPADPIAYMAASFMFTDVA